MSKRSQRERARQIGFTLSGYCRRCGDSLNERPSYCDRCHAYMVEYMRHYRLRKAHEYWARMEANSE